MHINSPLNMPVLSPQQRAGILRDIVNGLSDSGELKIGSSLTLDDLKYNLPKTDHPLKKEALIKLGAEQQLESGVNLSLYYGNAGKNPELFIRLDSRDFDRAPFGAQRGVFTFRLDAKDAKIGFIGIASADIKDQTVQPVLDSTLENRLTQLLDASLAVLNETLRSRQELRDLSKLVLPGLIDENFKNIPSKNQLIPGIFLKIKEIIPDFKKKNL